MKRSRKFGLFGVGVAVFLLAAAGLVLSRRAVRARDGVSEETVTLGGLKVTVWSRAAAPAAAANAGPAREPVVIFSHGFHGCSTQSRFLMEALAEHGYLVFAPNHADAVCNGGPSKWSDPAEQSFGSPQLWTDQTYADRAADIRNLIAAIEADARFGPLSDFSRLSLAGHSLGGYTVLGLGGAWPSWTLPDVKAVLALSPYTQPYLLQKTLGGMDAPVMYQGGTLDFHVTPFVSKNGGAYDESPAPKYFVDFYGAGHLAWTNIGSSAPQPDIVAYSVAFLDHSVKDLAADPVLTEARRGVYLDRYDSELGNNGAGVRGKR